jgi:predicted nucleic acid-binding Zn ribbon protein
MKWDENDLKILIELTKNGKNSTEISRILNRTKKSVKCKLRVLGENYEKNNKKIKTIKKCLNCGIEIKNNKKFCNNSCSAIHNNKLRRRYSNCLNCNTELNYRLKYCSPSCRSEQRKREIFKEIENGNNKLYFRNYKNFLIEKYGEKCNRCGWCERNPISGKIPIELEHKDGNSENNSLENLELLCPNCHSLTPTYKDLNTGNGRHKRRERYKNGKSF